MLDLIIGSFCIVFCIIFLFIEKINFRRNFRNNATIDFLANVPHCLSIYRSLVVSFWCRSASRVAVGCIDDSPICFHLKSVDVDLKYDEFITTYKCNKIITRTNAISMFYFSLIIYISYLYLYFLIFLIIIIEQVALKYSKIQIYLKNRQRNAKM